MSAAQRTVRRRMRSPAVWAACVALMLLGALAYARSGATAQVAVNAAGGTDGVPPTAQNPHSEHNSHNSQTMDYAMPATPGVRGESSTHGRLERGRQANHRKATRDRPGPSTPPAASKSAGRDHYWTPEKMASAKPAAPGVRGP